MQNFTGNPKNLGFDGFSLTIFVKTYGQKVTRFCSDPPLITLELFVIIDKSKKFIGLLIELPILLNKQILLILIKLEDFKILFKNFISR